MLLGGSVRSEVTVSIETGTRAGMASSEWGSGSTCQMGVTFNSGPDLEPGARWLLRTSRPLGPQAGQAGHVDGVGKVMAASSVASADAGHTGGLQAKMQAVCGPRLRHPHAPGRCRKPQQRTPGAHLGVELVLSEYQPEGKSQHAVYKLFKY